ncbi:MAG: hypothetical protein IJ729_02945 [Alloprevotella sp.]|nr:hypothetical protein [Alloprevotella sp.]
MNEQMELNGALCADGQTGDVAQAADAAQAAAPAEGKKKYVPPTMQVIPLGPQRMLATSGLPPVRITLYTYVFDDYVYAWDNISGRQLTNSDYITWRGKLHEAPTGVCVGAKGWAFECSDLGSSFPGRYAAANALLNQRMTNVWACTTITNYDPTVVAPRCGSVISNAGLPLRYAFSAYDGGVALDWNAEEFFAGAQFDACSSSGSFSGTYDGRRFEGRIDEFSNTDFRCGTPSNIDYSGI